MQKHSNSSRSDKNSYSGNQHQQEQQAHSKSSRHTARAAAAFEEAMVAVMVVRTGCNLSKENERHG